MPKRNWTRKQVEELGIRTTGILACQILYGVGATKARQLLRTGNVDFKIIRVPNSRQVVVPVSSILRVLDELDEG